jgi:DNA-binding CsgD family transcriptional regulator
MSLELATIAAVTDAVGADRLDVLGWSLGAGLPPLRRAVPTGLTARQAEVAALVAEGLTNRQLAERLGITERSAESHLERIRLRLGFSSRAQLAVWYVAHQA